MSNWFPALCRTHSLAVRPRAIEQPGSADIRAETGGRSISRQLRSARNENKFDDRQLLKEPRFESQNSFGPQQIRQDNRAGRYGYEAKIRGTGEDRRERGVTGVATFSHILPMEVGESTIDLEDCELSLKRYFSRRVRASWEVEDLVQESLARFIAVNRSSLTHPFGYLFRIANNLLVDRARRASNTPPLVVIANEHQHPTAEPNQEDLLHLADLRSQLELALDELPVKCREAFILRRFHAMDTPAIADRLNVSHRMVQKYLTRAMEHLHFRLRQREDPGLEVSQGTAVVEDAHTPCS